MIVASCLMIATVPLQGETEGGASTTTCEVDCAKMALTSWQANCTCRTLVPLLSQLPLTVTGRLPGNPLADGRTSMIAGAVRKWSARKCGKSEHVQARTQASGAIRRTRRAERVDRAWLTLRRGPQSSHVAPRVRRTRNASSVRRR